MECDVVVIGAGTAGLTAYREAKKVSDKVILIHKGPFGTTCARVGCMPSKVLIQVAEDYHRKQVYAQEGILGADHLSVHIPQVLKHVRSLRDRFVRAVMGGMESFKNEIILGEAKYLSPHTIKVGTQTITCKKSIIATGSTPTIPAECIPFEKDILTTDTFFEQENLPSTMAVLGTGVIGLEIGQALSRLGIDTSVLGRSKRLAGLSDPIVNTYAIEHMGKELCLHFASSFSLKKEDGLFHITHGQKTIKVEKILLAQGRRPNIYNLGFENLGIDLSTSLSYDPITLKMADVPIFLAGDVNERFPVLHEAADDGTVAGYNATHEPTAFKRRSALKITFSDPNIASIGTPYSALPKDSYVTGRICFEGQGRSIVKQKECGLLHLYARKTDGLLLGAELFAPDGEHLAHLLSWCHQNEMTVFDILRLPFYHPVIEEGLRTALRDAASQIDTSKRELVPIESS